MIEPPSSICIAAKTYGNINRQPWSRLWYYCKHSNNNGSGRIILYFLNIERHLNASRATIYRWLNTGRMAGAFRAYKRRGNWIEIYIGSREAILKAANKTDWGATVETDLETIRSTENDNKLRQITTKHQAAHLQRRSQGAATKQTRHTKTKHKLAKPDFRRATARPTCQFFRKKHQYGASQETIAKSLGISSRSVRRHLDKVERVQGIYKVNKVEGQEDQFLAKENWQKPKTFYRKGEYWKYGTNIYDLDIELKTQWTARLKYKYKLLKNFALTQNFEDKEYLYKVYNFFKSDWFSNLDLEKLININNFDKFRKEVTRQLKQNRRTIQGGQK